MGEYRQLPCFRLIGADKFSCPGRHKQLYLSKRNIIMLSFFKKFNKYKNKIYLLFCIYLLVIPISSIANLVFQNYAIAYFDLSFSAVVLISFFWITILLVGIGVFFLPKNLSTYFYICMLLCPFLQLLIISTLLACVTFDFVVKDTSFRHVILLLSAVIMLLSFFSSFCTLGGMGWLNRFGIVRIEAAQKDMVFVCPTDHRQDENSSPETAKDERCDSPRTVLSPTNEEPTTPTNTDAHFPSRPF